MPQIKEECGKRRAAPRGRDPLKLLHTKLGSGPRKGPDDETVEGNRRSDRLGPAGVGGRDSQIGSVPQVWRQFETAAVHLLSLEDRDV
jgi:hypothetical protein